jgi:TP901 family phage tail tape measure protein
MAEQVHSDIIINVDTSVGIAEIKNLQRQISSLNATLMQSGAAQAKAAQNIQRNLLNNINATGQFAARVKTIASTTETFTERLEKNKLGMGEYFRYAGGASKTFGKLFRSEFDTIEKVARERVKTLQTQYTKLGRDANGALKAISVRPLALDMENLATKTALAAQKQQLMNQLLKQGSTNLLNFGKNTQWAGRQLMVGFSIPLAYLGTAAAKTFMKMEEQALRFKRVYGDTFTSSAETDKMIEQVKTLANEFTKYGVAVEKTMQMAANAAAMGKMGSDLLAQINQATRLAVLGGVEQEQALETTISLTNAFGIAADKLSGKIDFLNAVENQTVTSIEDLTVAVPKAGPVVQQLGGDVEDLAFFLTAMKEGGINASEGANALKSGLASLINPTAKASEMLAGFGVNIKGIVEANSGNVKGIVVDFAKALDTLDPLNRARAIEQLFGKFQFARLSTLFQNVIAEGSQANRVLKLSNATTAELAVLSEREMKRIEDSPMYKFKKVVEDIKVSLVPLGEAFLKAITPIGEFVKGFLDKFNSMGDGAKQFAVIATTVIAGIGPVLLMTFGLIANGAANMIKLFLGIRRVFQGVGGSSQTLGSQTEYMTMQQLEAAAVAASLDQNHSKLIQTFTSETNAVNNLATAYARAVVAQGKLLGINPGVVAAKSKAPVKLKNGIVSVPGPRGAGDIVPAMLAPGEAVIPAKMASKYSGLINGMVDGTVPGFQSGYSPFKKMATRKYESGESSVKALTQAERDKIYARLQSDLRSSPSSLRTLSSSLGTYGSFDQEEAIVNKVFKDAGSTKASGFLGYDLSHKELQKHIIEVEGKQYEAKKWSLDNLQRDHRVINQALNYLSLSKVKGPDGKKIDFFKSFSAVDLSEKTGLSKKIVDKEIKALIRGDHPSTKNSYMVLAEMAKSSDKVYAKALRKVLEFRLSDASSGSYLKALAAKKLTFDPTKVDFDKAGSRATVDQTRRIKNAIAKLGGAYTPAATKTPKQKAPAPTKTQTRVAEQRSLAGILAEGMPASKASSINKASLFAKMFGRRMAFGGIVPKFNKKAMISTLLDRSRVATRMSSQDLLSMLGRGDTKYRNAFETGTGADYLTKNGLPNTNQARTRRMMEKDAMGIGWDAPASQRPTYGSVALVNPIVRILSNIFGGMRGRQFNRVANPMSNSLDIYGETSLIGKRSIGKRSNIFGNDILKSYARNTPHWLYRNQQGMGLPPMYGGKDFGVASGNLEDVLSRKFGTSGKSTMTVNGVQGMWSNPGIPYIESYTKGGFDLKEISKIISKNPEAVPLIRAALKAQGIKIPVRAMRTGVLGKIFGFKDGVVSVPGPRGAGDVVPAMLSPGEAVIPAKMTDKYSPLINSMIDGKVPGYVKGKKGSFNYGSDYSPYQGILAPPIAPTTEPAPIVKNESKFGKVIGQTLGTSKKLISGVSTGIGKVASMAAKEALSGVQLGALKAVGSKETGAYSELPNGKILDNGTGKLYKNKAAFDTAQSEIKNARTPGTSYTTPTGKVYKVDEKGKAKYSGTKVQRTSSLTGSGGKFMSGAGAIGGVASMAGMGMMMSGDQSGMGNNLMMGGMALSMLPMLANKAGLVVAGLAAVIGAFVYFKIKSEEATKAGLDLGKAMSMNSKKLEEFAAINGTVTASQEARKNAELQLTGENAKKRYYGQTFLESEAGKGLLSNAETMTKAGKSSKEVAANFAQQLSYAVVQGAITQEQAMSIAAALGEKLQDYSITANIDGQLVSLLGRNGENLLKDPLSITLEIQKQSTKQQVAAYENSLSVATGNAANDGLVVGLMGAAGVMGTIAADLAIAAVGTAGTSLIPAAIAGVVAAGLGGAAYALNLADEEENNKARGVAVQLGAEQIAQNQGLVDSIEKQYALQIKQLQEKKKAAKTDKERKDLEGQITDKVNARTTAVEKQRAANKAVFDGLVKQAGQMGGGFNAAIGMSIDERFKDSTGAVKAAATLAKGQLEGLSDTKDGKQNVFKTTLQIGLASGEFDPITVSNLAAMAAKDGKIETSFGVLVDAKGTSEANQIIQLLAKAGTDSKEYTVILDYLNANSDTFKEDQEALAQIANMPQEYGIVVKVTTKGIEDVREFTDETSILNNGKPITREILTNFLDNTANLTPETRATIQEMITNWDVLSGGDNKLKYNVIVDYKVGEADDAAILAAYGKEFGIRRGGKGTLEKARAWFFGDGRVKDEGTPDPGTGTTGDGTAKKDPIDDLLNRLKMVRDASIKASGGMATLRKIVGKTGGKNITAFAGIEQNLFAKENVSQEFMDFYDSLDAKAKSTYVSISGSGKNAVAKLTNDAKALMRALREISLGDFQSALVKQKQDAMNSALAFKKLKDAGMSAKDALEVSKDASLANAIATVGNTQKVLDLVKAFNELADAQDAATRFQKTFDDAREAWDAKKNKLEIDFKVNTKDFQKTVTDAENDIAKKINQAGGLDDLQAGLTQIGWAEDEINKKYDLRLEALDRVADVNDRILAAQRGQLTIADALSRGDISAAAAAIQDQRARESQDAIASQKDLLENARNAELGGVTADVNGVKMTRKDIEAKILVIEKEILDIEEKRLEPARESIRLEEVKRVAAIASLEEQELEWQKLENDIALAATAAWDYVSALEAAKAAAAQAVVNASSSIGQSVTNAIQTGGSYAVPTGGVIAGGNYFSYMNQPAYKASGGIIPKYFSNGDLAKGTDVVPAMLTPGEFIMSKYAVDSFGVDNMKAINSGTFQGSTVYNSYDLNVNVRSDANPNEIARVVMTQIKQVDSQRARGIRL